MTNPDPLFPPALAYAQALLAQLIAQGVRDIVLCPGSRSAPLAYAAVAAQRAGLIRLHVLIDERSAGFLALGLGKGSAAAREPADGDTAFNGVPAAVITTSGTAVANLHPAVLEAHHSNIPLIVLSADRPHELRGTGANQTTTQVGIFADAPRLLVDAGVPHGGSSELSDARALAARAYGAAVGVTGAPGPVHLNLGFREPLAPNAQQLAELGERFTTQPTPVYLSGRRQPATSDFGGDRPVATDVRTVIVAGDGSLTQAGAIAAAQGWPIIAEPSSGLIAHSHTLPGAVNILAGEGQAAALTQSIEQVLVFGHPTLSRPVQRLIGREDVRTIVFPTFEGQWVDAPRAADAILYAIPNYLLDPSGQSTWLERWQELHTTLAQRFAETFDSETELTGPNAPMRAVRALVAAAKPGDTLVFGASSAIRDADTYVTHWPQGVQVFAHRGLAGIDGTLSMARGVALTARRRTRVIVGDLTFLHDVGGLLRSPQDPGAHLDIVVLNDCGGAIFGGLEHAAAGDFDLYERVFGTPHNVDLAQLCFAYELEHLNVLTTAELNTFLAPPAYRAKVAELRYSREQRSEIHAQATANLF